MTVRFVGSSIAPITWLPAEGNIVLVVPPLLVARAPRSELTVPDTTSPVAPLEHPLAEGTALYPSSVVPEHPPVKISPAAYMPPPLVEPTSNEELAELPEKVELSITIVAL